MQPSDLPDLRDLLVLRLRDTFEPEIRRLWNHNRAEQPALHTLATRGSEAYQRITASNSRARGLL